LDLVLLQQVGPVIEQPGVGVPGQTDEGAIDRVVLDDSGEVLLGGFAEAGLRSTANSATTPAR
jgi:hypothetical protein